MKAEPSSVPARVGGVDLSVRLARPSNWNSVPARVGGVDLSFFIAPYSSRFMVPARVGGVDLSYSLSAEEMTVFCPRPCGRGGFKQLTHVFCDLRHAVPARVGGVDLSSSSMTALLHSLVPARVGGVDLSSTNRMSWLQGVVPARVGGVDLSKSAYKRSEFPVGPRPCGRGGFKPYLKERKASADASPPVWAGWI